MTAGWRVRDACLPDVASAQKALLNLYPMVTHSDGMSSVFTSYGASWIVYSSPSDVLVMRLNPAMNYAGSGTPTRVAHTYALSKCDVEADSAVCVPSSTTVAPCPSGFAPQGQDVGYDYITAGAIWAFFFCFVVSLWIVSRNAGLLIEGVRKW